MRTVEQILLGKTAGALHLRPDDSVLEAIRLMAENHVGALLVMEGPALVGIVSERDYARKVVLHGRSSSTTRVAEIMSSPVMTVSPDTTVTACLTLMTNCRIRHLPVVAGHPEQVVGVLSIGDLVKAVIDDQAHQIEDLERFIRG